MVCDCCSFSDVNVSQGSVETHTRGCVIFSIYFAANLLQNLTVKNENLLRNNRVTTMRLVSPFSGHGVSVEITRFSVIN